MHIQLPIVTNNAQGGIQKCLLQDYLLASNEKKKHYIYSNGEREHNRAPDTIMLKLTTQYCISFLDTKYYNPFNCCKIKCPRDSLVIIFNACSSIYLTSGGRSVAEAHFSYTKLPIFALINKHREAKEIILSMQTCSY